MRREGLVSRDHHEARYVVLHRRRVVVHVVRNAMVSDDLEDDLRLYLGPSRSGSLIEVIVIVRGDGRSELAIHAMPMRDKYRRLLPGE